jgi:hypothetical protein
MRMGSMFRVFGILRYQNFTCDSYKAAVSKEEQ